MSSPTSCLKAPVFWKVKGGVGLWHWLEPVSHLQALLARRSPGGLGRPETLHFRCCRAGCLVAKDQRTSNPWAVLTPLKGQGRPENAHVWNIQVSGNQAPGSPRPPPPRPPLGPLLTSPPRACTRRAEVHRPRPDVPPPQSVLLYPIIRLTSPRGGLSALCTQRPTLHGDCVAARPTSKAPSTSHGSAAATQLERAPSPASPGPSTPQPVSAPS